MKFNTMLFIAVVLCLLTAGVSLYYSLSGEKVCLANKCVEEVTGDAWAAMNCKVNEDKSDMICQFSIDKKDYTAPLSQLNTSQFKSCVKEKCAVAVRIYKEAS
jgi:hypothetical protein